MAMTSGDRKGDTAKGAKAIAKAQAKSTRTRRKTESKSDVLTDLGIVPSWDQYPELNELGFGELVERRTLLKDEIEFRKAKMQALDEQIEAAMMVAGTEKVTWEGRPVQVVHSRSGSKIVAEKLLLMGVPAQTIADCTEEGKRYQYVLVGKPGKQT